MSSPKKIIGSYELGKTLGKGSYSTVKRGYHIATRNEVAIKVMSPGKGKCDIEDIEREIAILKLLKHPNIIQLLDVINDETTCKIYLVFELVNGGDLFDYTIARGRLSEREARRIMREVISAVAFCHSNMVVHRDIKLENLLMDKDGHAKIADFGMSALMQTGLKMNTFCGSPMYMSPEIVQGLGYGPGVDIWSLGIVLYAIVVGCTPWRICKAKEMVEDLDAMLRGEYTYPPDIKLSPECEELISLMLVPDHARRASIEQIMEHPWLLEGYEKPVTLSMNVVPVLEVNELVLKNMLAMGYSEVHVRKAISESTPSPARMVYQHMVYQMEEGFEPIIPASPRRHSRHSSASSCSSSSSSSLSPRIISPRSASTSPRRQILLDGRVRALSDASIRRKSLEIVASPLSQGLAASPLSQGLAAPISPRTALTSRQAHMSTIKEENPVCVATENPGPFSPRGHRNKLPSLALPQHHHSHHHSSYNPLNASTGSIVAPLSPSSSPLHASAPTSPTSPRNILNLSAEEPLVAVRGAFNVATTTLKPRRVLIAEIARTLEKEGITSLLSRSVFACKVSPSSELEKVAEQENAQEDYKQVQQEDGESEDKLKFEVEVCRVAGMEMLLGVRFQRVKGNKDEYQEMCNKLIASMKL